MARVFSIAGTLRMTPIPMVREFLQHLGHGGLDIPWERLAKDETDTIAKALQELPRGKYDTVEAALRQVHDLACTRGLESLIDAARSLEDAHFVSDWPIDQGPYHKSLWSWLERPAVFARAILLHEVDQMPWWRLRDDLPGHRPDLSAANLQLLEQDLSLFLQEKQGRGRECTVERLTRDETEYLFANPVDFVQNVHTHSDSGRLTLFPFRRTFQIVFALRPKSGTLELCTRMHYKLKAELESLFVRRIYSQELGPWPGTVYSLDHLADRTTVLDTDPEDGFDVHIKRLRLHLPDSNRRITLEADLDAGGNDIHDMIEQLLNRRSSGLGACRVTLPTLVFVFKTADGRQRGSMTFDIATPNSCSLRHQPPARVALAQKYLFRWRIARDRSLDVAPAATCRVAS